MFALFVLLFPPRVVLVVPVGDGQGAATVSGQGDLIVVGHVFLGAFCGEQHAKYRVDGLDVLLVLGQVDEIVPGLALTVEGRHEVFQLERLLKVLGVFAVGLGVSHGHVLVRGQLVCFHIDKQPRRGHLAAAVVVLLYLLLRGRGGALGGRRCRGRGRDGGFNGRGVGGGGGGGGGGGQGGCAVVHGAIVLDRLDALRLRGYNV